MYKKNQKSNMLKVIQIQFFAFVLIIVTISLDAQMEPGYLKRAQSQINTDVTHDLTDNDLKWALSDLSLRDLKSLEAVIDSADHNDLDYQENSSTIEKCHSNDFDQQEFDYSNDNPDQDDYSFEPKDIENNLDYYLKRQENQRAKRHDPTFNSNDEYMKQLVDSFPQNEQQNYNGIAKEEAHIRVKRH